MSHVSNHRSTWPMAQPWQTPELKWILEEAGGLGSMGAIILADGCYSWWWKEAHVFWFKMWVTFANLGHQQKKIPAEIFHLEVVIRGFGDRGVDRFPEVCGSIWPSKWMTYPPWHWNSCETSLNPKKCAKGLTETQIVQFKQCFNRIEAVDWRKSPSPAGRDGPGQKMR